MSLGLNARSHKVDKVAKKITELTLKASKRAIPRGSRKNYRPFWTEELEDLENEVNKARKDAEENPGIDSNIKLKETTASSEERPYQLREKDGKKRQQALI